MKDFSEVREYLEKNNLLDKVQQVAAAEDTSLEEMYQNCGVHILDSISCDDEDRRNFADFFFGEIYPMPTYRVAYLSVPIARVIGDGVPPELAGKFDEVIETSHGSLFCRIEECWRRVDI